MESEIEVPSAGHLEFSKTVRIICFFDHISF